MCRRYVLRKKRGAEIISHFEKANENDNPQPKRTKLQPDLPAGEISKADKESHISLLDSRGTNESSCFGSPLKR